MDEETIAIKYSIVILCATIAIIWIDVEERTTVYIMTAMIFTVVADYFLLVTSGRELVGLICFFMAQIFHAACLTRMQLRGRLLELGKRNSTGIKFFEHEFTLHQVVITKIIFFSVLIRSVLCMFSCIVVISLNIDDSMIYVAVMYAFLLVSNFLQALVISFKDRRAIILAVGFLLFIICDIFVGLNFLNLGTSNAYAYICWIFYVPSQVLLVLSPVFMASLYPMQNQC